MNPKKAQVKDLVHEAFQDEEVQEMFGNLMTHCHRHERVTGDALRDLLMDLVVESYMLINTRKNVALETGEASRSWQGLEAASNTDSYTMTGHRLELQESHNTNVSNNTQSNVTSPSLSCARGEVSKETVKITDIHDASDRRQASSGNSHPQNASREGSIYKRVLSALRLTKKEHITTDDDCRPVVGSNTSEHIPCDPPKTMSDHDDKLRRVWMRLSDPASDDTSSKQDVNNELTTSGVEIDANLATRQETPVKDNEGLVCEEEPSLLYKTFMAEMQEAMGIQNLTKESDGESNLDEYESASDNDTDLESWHSNGQISLSRASSSSFLTASDHLDEVVDDDLEEEVDLAKTIRPQFLGKYYVQRLANARQTAAEIKARKPEPRVKLDKPCRLDTNLTYAVRQSLKRSLPLIAGKNKFSALMMMADGMFDEMSLDRDLDDLAWPCDPLAELRESGLAMVDYMEPPPTDSATMNTTNMKDQSSPSESVTCSTTAQDVPDLNRVDPANNKDDDLVETLEHADSLNLTPIASSGQPTNLGVSDAVVVDPLVSFSPKLETVSSVPKENVKSLHFLFKPLKSVVDTILDTGPFRVLVNQIQLSQATDGVSEIQLLPPDYENSTQTTLVPISDQPPKLHLATLDHTNFNITNAMSDISNTEARSSRGNCYVGDGLKNDKELSQTLDIVKEIRPQFLGKFYLKRLANARQTAAEIKARKPEPRVKIDKPCRLDTNLMFAVHQSLKSSLPLIAGRNKLSALMMMADGMFDEMSLDRNLDDLAWPYDPLAELRKSGLAMVDYVSPYTTDDPPRTATTFDRRNEVTSVEISSSDMGKNLLPEISNNKDSRDLGTSNADSYPFPSQPANTESIEVTRDRESPRTYLQRTFFDYPAVPPPQKTDVVPSDGVLNGHQDCLHSVSVDCGQISVSSSDSVINTDDVTAGLLSFEMSPLRKEDDHQSDDSALGEENSATSLYRDGDDDESEITNLTQTNLHLNDHEEGLEFLFKPISSTSIGDDEVLSPTVAGTVSSNVRLFEHLTKDSTERPLKSSKMNSIELPNKSNISEDIKKRAQVFENFDVCRPLSNAKQTMHSTEDDKIHTVNIKTQVAMFEKLFGGSPSS